MVQQEVEEIIPADVEVVLPAYESEAGPELWLQLNCPDAVWTIGSGPLHAAAKARML